MPSLIDPSLLLERFPIAPPGSPPLRGELYATRSRPGGRRVVVRDAAGLILLDTDDCYDLGNATNRLDLWLEAKYPLTTTGV